MTEIGPSTLFAFYLLQYHYLDTEDWAMVVTTGH
jgi:hypothetical protein